MGVKRALWRWALLAGVRELMRTRRMSAEKKVALGALGGIAVAPFVVVIWGGAYVWWLITGKRLPGPPGRWVGPPSRLLISTHPKQITQLPVDMRAVMDRIRESAAEK